MTMPPRVATPGRAITVRPMDRVASALARCTLHALLGLLLAAALALFWRRCAGALQTPLPTAMLVSVGLATAALALGLRVAWRELPDNAARPLSAMANLLPSVALLVLGLSLISVPGTALGAQIVFWGLLIAEEIVAWQPVWRLRQRQRRSDEQTRPTPEEISNKPPEAPAPPQSTAQRASPSPEADVWSTDTPAGQVTQQLLRCRAASGAERISGRVRASFAAGQRTANVHVAFCPPLEKTPRFDVEQIDGPKARIKTAQLLPHGVRLDLKLSTATDDPVDVVLEFAAEGS